MIPSPAPTSVKPQFSPSPTLGHLRMDNEKSPEPIISNDATIFNQNIDQLDSSSGGYDLIHKSLPMSDVPP